MSKNRFSSFVKCGKVFSPDLPAQLDASQTPIVLAEVTVKPNLINRPCVLLQYSQFINFSTFGLNPKFVILYRLVRERRKENYPQILQKWEFEFESSEIANLDTNQPTVLTFCDCLNCEESEKITYKLEIIQIETNNVRSFGITNKSFTATLLSEAPKNYKGIQRWPF